MRNRIFCILVLTLLFSFCVKNVSANELCSSSGYTILTINGIFTDESGAKYNRDRLKDHLSPTYNNQPLKVDYLYNPTHLGGLGDLVDLTAEGLFNEKSDYDLTGMINDASKEVTTQKLLLVGHSQGNFYANNFYDKVVDQTGGIPAKSIGVYGVATPASSVAGGGKYITSDTDKAIVKIAGKFFPIMKPNTHIVLGSSDDTYGHDFSNVYLKYRSDKIISDIKSSLNTLSVNNVQNTQTPCIATHAFTGMEKVQGIFLSVADPIANVTKNVITTNLFNMSNEMSAIAWLYNSGVSLVSNIGGFSNNNLALVETPEVQSKNTNSTNEVSVDNSIATDTKINSNEDQLVTSENVTNAPVLEDEVAPSVDQTSPVVTESLPANNPPVVTLGTGGGGVATPNPETKIEPTVVDNTAPVISIIGDNPTTVIIGSTYTDLGATATDDTDTTISVTTTGLDTLDTSTIGAYDITYTAKDIANNTTTAIRTVNVIDDKPAHIYSYKYIPNYTFGRDNGDGHDWQVWGFNGANIYDWSDTYIDNYLHEQFKLQTYSGGYSCSRCLQRGIFNHNPQIGFDSGDFSISILEDNPQNNGSGITYDVTLQWDQTGYTYTISHDSIVDSTGHTNVTNMNNGMWVGWDASDNFTNSPSGNWSGVISNSPASRTGGANMMLKPYPVYKYQPTSLTPTLSFPASGAFAGTGISPTRGRKNVTPFTFQVVYTDKNNNAPQNVKLHVKNTTTGNNLPDVEMQKVSQGANTFSDGNFTNGEYYSTNATVYDEGEYDYYFTASDNNGNNIRTPDNSTAHFGTVSSAYTYIPNYTFGTNNGDGHDWQVWGFNGSNVYDWSDIYVDNYLKEQFKIQSYGGGSSCSFCLQRGIFNHDPQKGFEASDVSISSLEDNPQNRGTGKVYDVIIEWDSTGYTYTISHDDIIDSSGHTDVSNVNENMWIGWDISRNNFQTFPSGDWVGASGWFPSGYSGGGNMMLKPYPVYVYSGPVTPDPNPNPNPIPDKIPPSITSYTFNGNSESITTNPLSQHLAIVLNASENVNWMSIKIEKESDSKVYAIFQSGGGCVDWTSTCTKSWDGILTSGELLDTQNGVYKVRVHMQDLAKNDYEEYLPYTINVDTTH